MLSDHAYVLEDIIRAVAKLVHDNAEGELSEAEVTEAFYKVLDRAISLIIKNVADYTMEKAITQYGLLKTFSECAYIGINAPNIEDLYTVVLRKDIPVTLEINEGMLMDFYTTEYLMEN